MDPFHDDNADAEQAALSRSVPPYLFASPSLSQVGGDCSATLSPMSPMRPPCPSRWRCFRVLPAVSCGGTAESVGDAPLPDGWERIVVYVQDLWNIEDVRGMRAASHPLRRLELLRKRFRPSPGRTPDDPDDPPPALPAAKGHPRDAPISGDSCELRRAA